MHGDFQSGIIADAAGRRNAARHIYILKAWNHRDARAGKSSGSMFVGVDEDVG
jgi:hypothetical protein